MLRNYFSQQMSAITDGNQSLMRWVDAQRWTLYFHYDIVTDYTEKTGGLQGIAAAAWSRIHLSVQTKSDNAWYTLDGKRLSDVPSKKGLYIHKGKKVIF